MIPNEQFREARLQRGRTQRALSMEAGVSLATLSAIEKYSYVPGPAIRARIAAALELEIADIWPPVPDEATVA